MIVITGGAGFIGSNVVAALDERGTHDVVVCDRLGSGEKWRNLVKHEVADIIAPEQLLAFLDEHGRSVDTVIHMGAITSTTERDADLTVWANFTFSLDLWRWCAAHQCRLIYASSAATYGDGTSGFDDDSAPTALARLQPLNLYGWTKHLFDRRVARLVYDRAERPPQWAGLKLFNVYGPNEYHKGAMRSVALQVYERAARGEPVKLFRSHRPDYADGGQRRDFVSVHDCVGVILWLLDNPHVSGLFNLGTGQARSFAELADAVFAALGKETDVIYVDMPPEVRTTYQYFTEASVQRLRAAGYAAPFRSLEEGVGEYVRDYLSRADPYR